MTADQKKVAQEMKISPEILTRIKDAIAVTN